MLAMAVALVTVEHVAHADSEADEAEVVRGLESRNATRGALDRAKAEAEQRRMAAAVETSEDKERELHAADEHLRGAVATEHGRIVRKTLGVWTTIGGSVVALAGVGLYVSAVTSRSSIEDGSLRTGADIQSAANRIQTYAPVGITLVCVGAVAAGIGVALVLGSKKPANWLLPNKATGGLRLDPQFARLTW